MQSPLQMLFSIGGKWRAGNALQLQTSPMLEVFESLRQISEPGTCRTEERRIYLRQISETDDLRSVTSTGDNSLDLMRSQVLRLID